MMLFFCGSKRFSSYYTKSNMTQHHILTVGISLLTNFASERNLPAGEAAKHHCAVAEFLGLDPRKACAEIRLPARDLPSLRSSPMSVA
jgi:hypothetical protein